MFLVNPNSKRELLFHGISQTVAFQEFERFFYSAVQVFFRGASVNAIRGFPMSATMFLTYELSLQFFRGLQEPGTVGWRVVASTGLQSIMGSGSGTTVSFCGPLRDRSCSHFSIFNIKQHSYSLKLNRQHEEASSILHLAVKNVFLLFYQRRTVRWTKSCKQFCDTFFVCI